MPINPPPPMSDTVLGSWFDGMPIERARYSNGCFIPDAEARILRAGDLVQIISRVVGVPVGVGSVGRALQADADRAVWTVRFSDGGVRDVLARDLRLLRRNVSAPETFQEDDRVRVGDFYAQVDSCQWGGLYSLRREDTNLRSVYWGGEMTLVERDGVVFDHGAPPPPQCCPHCGRTTQEELVEFSDGSRGCGRCTSTCWGCEGVEMNYNLTYVDGDYYCNSCTTTCDECGYVYPADDFECPNEDSHYRDRGIHGYGHTRPSMWLGGPLVKKDDGKIDTNQPGAYYLGIELEVSAGCDDSAMWAYEWAEKHLGNRDAVDCKEDSSVEGYEIVTQPMTPQVFESVDWESFMAALNANHPIYGDEPSEHGLHVHIGRIAFDRDDVATAAYAYLLSQGSHLERIGRRSAYHYCEKVVHPVSAHISQMAGYKNTAQTRKVVNRGIYAGRDAVNLQNNDTIEIRAFRSTRSADDLRNAVRLTYLAADYIRYLRVNREAVSPKSLHWSRFAAWVAGVRPDAFASIAGIEYKDSNKLVTAKALVLEPNYVM